MLQSEKKLYWGLLAMNIQLFPSPWCSFFFNRFNSSFDQCNSIEVSSPPPILDMIVKCICWGSNNDFDDSAARAPRAWYLSHLSSWYLYIAGAFFMASNWDLFSASLGALSLPHCWLFSTLEQQTSANPKSAMLPCVPPLEIRQIKALHASVASSKCQWPT